jgi:hypothetical protein
MSPKIKKNYFFRFGEVISVCCENHSKHNRYTVWAKCSSYITANNTCRLTFVSSGLFIGFVASFYVEVGIYGQTVGRKDGHSEREWCLRKNLILLQYDVALFWNRIQTFRRNVCDFLQRSRCPRRNWTKERLKIRTEERNLLLHCCLIL